MGRLQAYAAELRRDEAAMRAGLMWPCRQRAIERRCLRGSQSRAPKMLNPNAMTRVSRQSTMPGSLVITKITATASITSAVRREGLGIWPHVSDGTALTVPWPRSARWMVLRPQSMHPPPYPPIPLNARRAASIQGVSHPPFVAVIYLPASKMPTKPTGRIIVAPPENGHVRTRAPWFQPNINIPSSVCFSG